MKYILILLLTSSVYANRCVDVFEKDYAWDMYAIREIQKLIEKGEMTFEEVLSYESVMSHPQSRKK